MAQDRRINVAELDFDQIKSNLIEFMEEQPGAFQDYNFEGSAMNTVIDVLAYITHINSMNAHFSLNETFIDTAQLRESVVSHAKLLGYTPRSTKPSIATVDVQLINPTNVTDEFGNYLPISLTRGTTFTTNIDSVTYSLFASDTQTINIDLDGNYIFKDVQIEQGILKEKTYVFDDRGFERYHLPDAYVNTDSVEVEVYTSSTSSEFITYAKSTNIANIKNGEPVYFLEESRDGLYEIKFGDGVIGKRPDNGNIIKIKYSVVSGGEDINGASIFLLSDNIGGNTNAAITIKSKAMGGSVAESIDSIRFNAPLGYVAQNRAVTPDDYKAIIQNNWGDVDTLTVWGGEDNIPPDYGKVYISIKPLNGEVLSDIDKETIKTNYLKPKNVVSITPILVDPDYTYIDLEVYFKYNPNVANITVSGLSSSIRETINQYDIDNLKSFGGVFRNSNLLQEIDATSVAVISNITRVNMHKKFTPKLGVETYYQFDFNQPLTNISGTTNIVRSSEFTYLGETCRLMDYYNTESESYIIQIVDSTDKVQAPNIGTVDKTLGRIILSGFAPDSIVGIGDQLKLITKPASSDIKPTRNELLAIDVSNVIIEGEVDTMITGGTTAGIDYTTVSN